MINVKTNNLIDNTNPINQLPKVMNDKKWDVIIITVLITKVLENIKDILFDIINCGN